MINHHTDPTLLQDVVAEALDAFWNVVAQRFPQAQSGDLSIEITLRFEAMAEQTVIEWMANNIPIPQGYRFALRHDVDRFPDFVANKGMTGTVTHVQSDGLITAKMDQRVDGAEEWENELWWEHGAWQFLYDTVPL